MLEAWSYLTYSDRIGYSKKGWTDGEMGLEWIKHFDLYTREKAAGRTRLLLVDGHNSHYTLEFLIYARQHNIVVICYPAHTTHIYQGLDVVIFSPLKRHFSEARDNFERTRREKVTKDNFLRVFAEAWMKAATPDNIKAAFRKTGAWPYDPSQISARMLAPSKETSYTCNLPLQPPSPVRVVSKAMAHLRRHDQHGESSASNAERCSPIPEGALQAAADLRAELASTSANFLVSSSPIRSTDSLPTLHPAHMPPLPPLPSSSIEPTTSAERQLMHENEILRGLVDDGRTVIHHQQAMLVIQDLLPQRRRPESQRGRGDG